MLIPLRSRRLLLPSSTVAEVIGYRDPDPVDYRLRWVQGRVNWQQRDIPVVDFERFMGLPDAAPGIRQRIVVCYALDAASGWPLFGLVAQGIPRLLRVSSETIDSARGGRHGESAVRMTLSIGGDDVIVPDLDYLHTQFAAL